VNDREIVVTSRLKLGEYLKDSAVGCLPLLAKDERGLGIYFVLSLSSSSSSSSSCSSSSSVLTLRMYDYHRWTTVWLLQVPGHSQERLRGIYS
jgi:hypothetical protein